MGIFDFFFKKNKPKVSKKFYATPSLYPSELEKSEILSLIHNSPPDSNIRALRYQARNIATSSPLINGYFDTLDKEIFGDNGIILDLHTQDSKLNIEIETKWRQWRAKQGDRLDSIYVKYYGDITLHSYEKGYNAFVLANRHLLQCRDFQGVCKGGEIIYLPNLTNEQSSNEVLGLWE